MILLVTLIGNSKYMKCKIITLRIPSTALFFEDSTEHLGHEGLLERYVWVDGGIQTLTNKITDL